MKSMRLLQIGDVHYPDAKANSAIVDLKDGALSRHLVSLTTPDRLQSVARSLTKLCQSNRTGDRIHVVLFSGDLTARGQLLGYKECLRYLNNVLRVADGSIWSQDCVHAVPGNHDVDRTLCVPTNPDMFVKFRPLVSAWQDLGLPILQASTIRQTTVSADGCSVEVFSLNSCVGCGEKRFLPAQLRDELHSLLETHVASRTLEEAFALVGEQLDTPAFLEEHLASLRSVIDELPVTAIPIVLAHHNILPQTALRLDIYTEVINGGLVRSRLSQSAHPVIYCHGHIHDDPIEIVTSPQFSSGPLISISAPPFSIGFNVIDIWCGQKNVPLGCVVKPYRLRPDASVREDEPRTVRIPLRQSGMHTELGHERIEEVLSHLSPKGFERFEVILSRLRSASEVHAQERSLAEPLLEAEWFGLVEILDREKANKHWQVRRVVP